MTDKILVRCAQEKLKAVKDIHKATQQWLQYLEGFGYSPDLRITEDNYDDVLNAPLLSPELTRLLEIYKMYDSMAYGAKAMEREIS